MAGLNFERFGRKCCHCSVSREEHPQILTCFMQPGPSRSDQRAAQTLESGCSWFVARIALFALLNPYPVV